MHMSDALLSPAVGAAGWGLAATMTVRAARRLERAPAAHQPALMGVLGAFVFAAQMVNFSIPGTGSSGHLAGALLLAALVGPDAAFLVMASILTVQALVFADGGLLALGCNLVNLGGVTCYLVFPLVFAPLAGAAPGRRRLTAAAVAAGVLGLALGAVAVVLETTLSGIARLPLLPFLAFLVPVHVLIGGIEGLVTAGVLHFVRGALRVPQPTPPLPSRRLTAVFAALALVVGGGLSWLASREPDGLEWSVARVAGEAELTPPATPVHRRLAAVQDALAVLPDYSFGPDGRAPDAARRVAADAQTSLSGVAGAVTTLLIAAATGLALGALRNRSRARAALAARRDPP